MSVETEINPFIYIGIDPGKTGAIAFYWPERGRLSVFDMPTRLRANGRSEVCPNVVASHLDRYTKHFRAIATVEKVAAMTGREGSANMFQFGRSFGVVLGALAVLRISVFETPPAVWKAKLNLDRDKKKSIVMARFLFPRHHGYFSLAKHDGRAEAALLAYWGWKSWRSEEKSE